MCSHWSIGADQEFQETKSKFQSYGLSDAALLKPWNFINYNSKHQQRSEIPYKQNIQCKRLINEHQSVVFFPFLQTTVHLLELKRYSVCFISRDDWSKIKHLLFERSFCFHLLFRNVFPPRPGRVLFCSRWIHLPLPHSSWDPPLCGSRSLTFVPDVSLCSAGIIRLRR